MEILIITACVTVAILLILVLHRPCIVLSRMLTREAQKAELEKELEDQIELQEMYNRLMELKKNGSIITTDTLYDLVEDKGE